MAEENQDPDWKKLEKVIADIQRVLAPNAVVQHDERVIGRSGALRKLDVSIRYSLGADPILIIVDCKHHSKDAVDRKEVAGFAEQLEDVRASLGIWSRSAVMTVELGTWLIRMPSESSSRPIERLNKQTGRILLGRALGLTSTT